MVNVWSAKLQWKVEKMKRLGEKYNNRRKRELNRFGGEE